MIKVQVDYIDFEILLYAADLMRDVTPKIKQFVQSHISCCQSTYSCLRGYTKKEFTHNILYVSAGSHRENKELVLVFSKKTRYVLFLPCIKVEFSTTHLTYC